MSAALRVRWYLSDGEYEASIGRVRLCVIHEDKDEGGWMVEWETMSDPVTGVFANVYAAKRAVLDALDGK